MVMASLPREWAQRAACASVVTSPATDVFFAPESGWRGMREESTAAARAREHKAKRICARCPVTRACLEFALATRQEHGVWGGLGPVEIRALQSARRLGSQKERPVATAVAAGACERC